MVEPRVAGSIIIYGGSPYANVATGDNTSSIDRIISQGFDGAYLDNVGVYSRTSGGGGWNAFEAYWLANGGISGEDAPYIPVTGVGTGDGRADIDIAIKSANGKGYSVYLKDADVLGPFTLYRNVNYNSKGAHIKGLTNGRTISPTSCTPEAVRRRERRR